MSRPTPNDFPILDVTARADDDVLAITGLTVAYRVRSREREVLSDVTFRVRRGEAYGLVGESGCGKSTLALAAMAYLPRNGRIKAGRIEVTGRDLATLDAEALRKMRAHTVSMVYQDPSRALNPSLSVGLQVSEAFEMAYGVSRAEGEARALDMLERVHIAAPRQVMQAYAHQLSGGMQQRVVIAMALAANPALLVLDEPTTGLDATVEAEVLDLVAQLRDELGTAVLFISHNLAVVGRMCSRVGVLYAGRLVEEGASADVFRAPHHPYTVGLLRCLPQRARSKDTERLDTIAGSPPPLGAAMRGCAYAERCRLVEERCRQVAPPPHRFNAPNGVQMARCHRHEEAHALPRERGASGDDGAQRVEAPPGVRDRSPVLRAASVSKTFVRNGQAVRAVDDVSITLAAGETLGLVGESGSGKTTLAKLIVGLIAPDPGATIELDGKALPSRVQRRDDNQVKSLQIVFQNPDAALNRAHSVKHLIGRALSKLAALRGTAHDARLASLIDAVRLPRRYLGSRTRQLSGGLKQRVAIARAFAGDPRIVVCDEPTSSLDVSVQAAILNLLVDLQRARGVSYVFISHDLDVVRYVSDRIAVLYVGRLVEIGAARDVFDGPHHPYTEALLSAVPSLPGDPSEARIPRVRLYGEPPSAAARPSGCVFQTRCPRKLGAICEQQDPPFADAGNGHLIRCHIPVSELRLARHELQGA